MVVDEGCRVRVRVQPGLQHCKGYECRNRMAGWPVEGMTFRAAVAAAAGGR